MNEEWKESVKTWLVIIMVISLIGAFVLFFMAHYKIALGLAGVFMALAAFLSQWARTKNVDYIHRRMHKNNHRY
ncbi:hypothetical protein [Neobacillus mesonae]|uniref:hypothetical protein n=1 Tax=Neobacillus mesonae TaxID=1193713 RepID=UPI00082CBB1D|nr:hypothetical protein [Neobacillus mesonae]